MDCWNKSRFSVATVTLVACCLLLWCTATVWGGAKTIRCMPRNYTHKALQTDVNGRRCWDDIKILACWGYCVSYEIADWQFPYKTSHHLVCGHNERKTASANLTHCDPGVQPGTNDYHYVEAVSCKCQVCSSENTSCEWLPPNSTLLEAVILREELAEQSV